MNISPTEYCRITFRRTCSARQLLGMRRAIRYSTPMQYRVAIRCIFRRYSRMQYEPKETVITIILLKLNSKVKASHQRITNIKDFSGIICSFPACNCRVDYQPTEVHCSD